jgi:hypothetical protein
MDYSLTTSLTRARLDVSGLGFNRNVLVFGAAGLGRRCRPWAAEGADVWA